MDSAVTITPDPVQAAPLKPTAAGDLADLIGSAAKSLAKVSGPNVVYEALRKAAPHLNLPPALGMPNVNEVMTTGLLSMIPEAEGEAGVASAGEAATTSTVEKAASALEHPGVKPWVNAAKAEAMKIPGANFLKTAYESAKGFAGATPEPPVVPTPGVPETNGIPWGTRGPGPLELRGKMIPTEPVASPSSAVTITPDDVPATVAPGADQSIPRTLSGESALRQVLTGQDNPNLLKIAKSRGISVSAESQLKPGVADNRLINKIVNDFSDDELDNVRSTYMQNQSKHQFGDIGAEAWKTKSLQTYFPDVKIPQATLTRTVKAVASAAPKAAPVATDDLTGILQESLKKARQLKELQ